MTKLILMRHGESMWNCKNLFTGWVDVPLTSKGIDEALKGGEAIKDIPIDVIVTSTLIRAQMTAMLAWSRHSSGKTPVFRHDPDSRLGRWGQIHSEKTEADCIPVVCSSELNERMYGDLQGLNKAETAEKFGKEQVKIWRRSYDTPPPNGESLKMTAARSIPYFEQEIKPMLLAGKSVFVSAHGNSLRSIIMDLDGLSEEAVLQLEVPTGLPILYELVDGKLARVAEQLG